ncbi:MAG: CotH kinase family protein, partial [Myxococcales bacterium]|nr:CotH kinase family protein [Myxococcales bacterium]
MVCYALGMRPSALIVTLSLLGLAALAACGGDGGYAGTGDVGDTVVTDTVAADIADATTGADSGAADVSDADTRPDADASADTDTAAPADTVDPADPSAVLFDPDRVIEVEITLAPADWAALRAETRAIASVIGPDCLSSPPDSPFTWFDADAVIDGHAVTNVGVRKKGFLGSLDPVRPSLKVRTDRNVDGQELLGVDRFTFNNGRQDPSRFAACLTYATFRAAGVPAPRCNLAHVTVNGEDLGVFTHVEDVKKDFMRRFYEEPFGDLYEGQLSDFRDGWTGTFEKQIDDDEPPSGVLDRVTAALDASDDDVMDALAAVVDLDELVAFWAVEVLVNHWDGYAGNTNNFFAYEEGPGGRLALLPWGADATFTAMRGDQPDDPDASPVFTL